MVSGWTSCRPRGRARVRMIVVTGMPVLMLGVWAVATQGVPSARGLATNPTVWDGVYSESQAERGKAAYEQQCASCHLSELQGSGLAPPLVDDTFIHRWQDGNLDDLFTIVKVTMPQDKPASLTDAEYADIVAYLLKSNQYPAGERELRPDPAVLKEVIFKRPGAGAKP
jgi:mono/diheme cytochrome c family protein